MNNRVRAAILVSLRDRIKEAEAEINLHRSRITELISDMEEAKRITSELEEAV